MILGGLTVACCNPYIATVNMSMAVGGKNKAIILICHSFPSSFHNMSIGGISADGVQGHVL